MELVILIPILFIVALALYCGHQAQAFANEKGYSDGWSWLIGAAFGPLGVFAFAILPHRTRDCPTCHEPNYIRRVTCNTCGNSMTSRSTEVRS